MSKKVKTLLSSALLFCLIFINTQTFSQSITGKWWGKLNLQGMEVRFIIQVESKDSTYSASIIYPDWSSYTLPLTSFELSYPFVKFGHSGANFSFNGFVDSDYKNVYGNLEHNFGNFNQANINEQMIFTHDSIPPAESSSANIKNKYDKTEVYIPMRDGKKLFTSYYIPKDKTEKYPILMFRTPYNSERGGENNFNFFMTAYYRFVKENYIMVFQDVRGRYMSEGEFEDIRPFKPNKKKTEFDEASDTYDAVDWLVKNLSSSNGKVGVTGTSYPGFYATLAILSEHPAIKAVSPQAPVTAWFIGDDFHHNGAFFLFDSFKFHSSFGKPRKNPSRVGQSGFKWTMQDSYQFFLDQGSIKSIKDKYFGDTIKFWNDVFNHPDYDDLLIIKKFNF